MAEYKAVDAGQLDADLTLVAEAIRKRAGTSEALAFPEGMAETVRNIPAEGLVLPQLTDPGVASDLAYYKQLIDAYGNVVTGTLAETEVGTRIHVSDPQIIGTPGNTVFQVVGMYSKNNIGNNTVGFICRPGAEFCVRNVPTSLFGDAVPEQVAKGATFTSAAGFLMEGTHECEGGVELPELGDTAGKPTDMAADKVLYDDEGNPVTGTLPVAADGVAVFSTADHEVGGTNGDTTFNVAGVYPGFSGDGVIVRPNARLGVRKVPTSLLGNATAADVVKGKTFTSAAGFLAEGTLEGGSGGVHMSVDGETLVITGAVTIENETLIL